MIVMEEDRLKNELCILLETHFCDVNEKNKHESQLRKCAEHYLSKHDHTSKAKIYKALADEKRLKILKLLTIREMCVCELTTALNLTQPNLTHHIKKLEQANLVDYEKRGKWVYYSLKDKEKLNQLCVI